MVRPVCLVPYYTEDVDKACTSFKVIKSGEEGYDHRFNIPTILEPENHLCLLSVCDKDIQNKVSHIQLVRVASDKLLDDILERFKATGATPDFLGPGYQDYLFLMWK